MYKVELKSLGPPHYLHKLNILSADYLSHAHILVGHTTYSIGSKGHFNKDAEVEVEGYAFF